MAKIVVGGVLERDGKFLLVQERQGEYYGKWSVPAGHLEPGETILEGAKREIREESGFGVELVGMLKVFSTKDLLDEAFVGIIFTTEIVGGEIYVDEEELLDVRWFGYDEIVAMKDRGELRVEDLIMESINAYREGKVVDLSVVGLLG